MNIFDYAMQMEYDGKQFYLELAEKGGDEGVKSIFEMLARDEDKHYKAVERMAKQEYNMADTDVLPSSKNIFSEMAQRADGISLDSSQVELYEQAKELEKKSEDFYNEKAEETDNGKQKELFKRMAAEERKHFNLLQNLIDLVNRPRQWLADAEWSHIGETY